MPCRDEHSSVLWESHRINLAWCIALEEAPSNRGGIRFAALKGFVGRSHISQQVMQYRLIACDELHTLDPLVFGKGEFDIDIDIVEHAGGRDFHGWRFDNEVRLA